MDPPVLWRMIVLVTYNVLAVKDAASRRAALRLGASPLQGGCDEATEVAVCRELPLAFRAAPMGLPGRTSPVARLARVSATASAGVSLHGYATVEEARQHIS